MDKRNILFILLLITLFVFHPIGNLVLANTYYIDANHPSANNSNPGTITLPWLTIQYASETIVAGDTVFIRNGIYNEHIITVNNGNTSDGYIVFASYPGENPVIDGTGITSYNNGFIVNRAYIKIIGLEVRNWNGCAIWVENAEHIEISNCVINNVEFGIGLADGTHHFDINNCEVYNYDFYGFDASPSGGADCYQGTFNDCTAHDWRNPALGHLCDGFAIGHGTQHTFTFNRCTAYNVGDGFVFGGQNIIVNRAAAYNTEVGIKTTGDNINIYNSISYISEISNLELDWDNVPGTTRLMNCTFYDAQLFGVWVENAADSLHMYNCIIAGSDNIGLAFEQLSTASYRGNNNIFHDDDGEMAIVVGYTDEFTLAQIAAGNWNIYSGQDANSLVVYSDTDLFTNPANYNLHILPSSLAIDNGTSNGAPSDDYEGNPRPSGQGYDIGAYEYQFATDVGDNNIHSNPKEFILYQNYPNPFNPTTIIKYTIPIIASGFDLSHVALKAYDILGREVAVLVNEKQSPGIYEIEFSASSGLASGIYHYQLSATGGAGNYIETKKMLLLK